jgi:hypothetical protein
MASNSKNKTDEVVINGIVSLLKKERNWIGTMTDLTRSIRSFSSHQERTMLPGSPSALRVVVNRVVNCLRIRGVSVRFNRTTDKMRTRQVKFSR